MVYKVIGLMSGSSLDGLDIVYTHLEEVRGNWSFRILHSECIPYPFELEQELTRVTQLSLNAFLRLHTRYGRYLGEQVTSFIERNSLHHKLDFIATHGHTVFHEPANHTTVQIGDGAAIAAITGRPVISDLRAVDVALGGQGAPIVPIGDKLLFSEYDYWLNIGGIANMTVRWQDNFIAFDICPANQVLNILASRMGKKYDAGGDIARSGSLLLDVLSSLNHQEFYNRPAPKSLSNEAAIALAFPPLSSSERLTEDLLRTMVQHIAEQVARAVKQYPQPKGSRMLITGGGAFNNFLIEQIQEQLHPLNVSAEVPDAEVVKFKEALVMALIGALRWREEPNVMSSVTGAGKDSIGGALWIVE